MPVMLPAVLVRVTAPVPALTVPTWMLRSPLKPKLLRPPVWTTVPSV